MKRPNRKHPSAQARWYLDIAGSIELDRISKTAGCEPDAFYTPDRCSPYMMMAKTIAGDEEPVCWRVYSRRFPMSRPTALFKSFEDKFVGTASNIKRLATRMKLRVELNVELDQNEEKEPQHDIVVLPPSTLVLLSKMNASLLIDVLW